MSTRKPIMTFHVRRRVKCIESEGEFKVGRTYTVIAIIIYAENEAWYYIEGYGAGWSPHRFVPIRKDPPL